jgi:2-polyprenyl-6-methoxyphenol hydroxylase-like FAD-dependent oxidoreductase
MDYLGFLVENRVITSALFERLQQLPSVKLFSPMSVQRIELEGNGAHGFTSRSARDCSQLTSLPMIAFR